MQISFDTWVITTKDNPIRFGTKSGELTNIFQEALFHSREELAKHELSEYDEPDKFQINRVLIDCEL